MVTLSSPQGVCSFVVLFMACVGLRINFAAEAERAQARARSAQSLGKG